jgi:hypothetical protein
MVNQPKISLKVPASQGQTLLVPDFPQMRADLHDNRDYLVNNPTLIQNQTLSDLRQMARNELLTLASDYMQRLHLPNFKPTYDKPLIVTGHQAGFHHAGIFMKYLLAHYLAASVDSIPLNLTVDSDLPGDISLNLPVRTEHGLSIQNIDLGCFVPNLPWQYQPLPTASQLETFITQLKQSNFPDQLAPAIENLTNALTDSLPAAKSLPDLFNQLNHLLTKNLAIRWLDLPVSVMSQSESFARFICDLLFRADWAYECYNRALDHFRNVNKIRSTSQPMPNLKKLGRHGLITESPLWIFTANQARKPLFVRQEDKYLIIANEQTELYKLPIDSLTDPQTGPQRLLSSLNQHNLQIQPRALTLTTFARLFLADYFIHGIGGTIYDQVTDLFIRAFYQIAPPAFACTSATLFLPLGEFNQPNRTKEQITKLKQQQRDQNFNPQRYLPAHKTDHTLTTLLEQRNHAIQTSEQLRDSHASAELRRQNFCQIHHLNQQIKKYIPTSEPPFSEKLSQLEKQLQQSQIAHNREFPFALFSPEQLTLLTKQLVKITSS